jgi:hypothetical protein
MSGSSYFGLRAILAEEERVPVQFNCAARGLGHLDPSSAGRDVAEDQRMDLALWLAAALGPSPGPNFVEVQLPSRVFGARLREQLRADAMGVRLRDRSPFFYELGLRVSDLVTSDETRELPTLIQAALAQRVAKILDHAPRSLGTDTSAFQGALTDLEQALFLHVQLYAAMRQGQRQGRDERLRAAGESTANALRAQARLPQSRGQKRERSLLQQ